MTHLQDLHRYHKGSGGTSNSTSLPQSSSASLQNWPGLKYSILGPMQQQTLTLLSPLIVIQDKIDQSRQAVPSLWYTFDSVQGMRVHTETKFKWKTECPWYSKEQGTTYTLLLTVREHASICDATLPIKKVRQPAACGHIPIHKILTQIGYRASMKIGNRARTQIGNRARTQIGRARAQIGYRVRTRDLSLR
ncbi:hypothetical protein B0H13DRAFT_1904784 [Mycena leptocephala]|nr:hypothetical protein B0H13DRAFT_1904784 [Mycena leptocephala]